jgi:hypothetical protein
MKPRHILPILAVVALAACAQFTSTPQPVSSGTLMTASAVVESVDQTTRRVQLRDASSGQSFTVVAGPEVRNLAQVEAGDTVEVDFFESTALAMADPADTGEAITTIAAATAPQGAMPGGLTAVSTSMVVTVVRYDAASGLATFTTPDGQTRRATVPPELRSFAEARQPGQRVLLTLTDAVAITLRPAGS